MVRKLTTHFRVNGQMLLAPDVDAQQSFEDIDSSEAGRDEAGYMHRALVREKVGSWSFSYASLTDDEYQYMENIFRGQDTFTFTFPGGSAICYRSKYSISLHNIKTGEWKNYSFNIIEC